MNCTLKGTIFNSVGYNRGRLVVHKKECVPYIQTGHMLGKDILKFKVEEDNGCESLVFDYKLNIILSNKKKVKLDDKKRIMKIDLTLPEKIDPDSNYSLHINLDKNINKTKDSETFAKMLLNSINDESKRYCALLYVCSVDGTNDRFCGAI